VDIDEEENRRMNAAIEELHRKQQAANTIRISGSDNVASSINCQGIDAAAGGGQTMADSDGNKEACGDQGRNDTGLLPDDVSREVQLLSNDVEQQQPLASEEISTFSSQKASLIMVKPRRSPRKASPLEKIIIAYKKMDAGHGSHHLLLVMVMTSSTQKRGSALSYCRNHH
jgi:hypothetical protein